MACRVAGCGRRVWSRRSGLCRPHDLGLWQALEDSPVTEVDSPEAVADVDDVQVDGEVPVVHIGGGVYQLPDGSRIRGRDAAAAALSDLEGS